MKKAFTMLELVFVIVVIGILAAVIIPNTRTNPLREAAIQLVSHIRYTQHLAMVDDKFDANDNTWYKKRWQMKFSKVGGSDNLWAYAIFSDTNTDGNPNAAETATNPINMTKKLTGGYSGTIKYDDADASNKLNLGHSYGVTAIDMDGGCDINADGNKRIAFDHLGRLIAGPLHNAGATSAYTGITLVQNTCRIVIKDADGNVTIAIEPETGYAHIL
jgi:prepilin-type N-terminal cleavage/methylation domain-containing protein